MELLDDETLIDKVGRGVWAEKESCQTDSWQQAQL